METNIHHTMIILSHETFSKCVAEGHRTVPVQHLHVHSSIFVDSYPMPIEDVREFFDVQPDRPDILWSIRSFGAVYDMPDYGDLYYLSQVRENEERVWHYKHRGWGDIPERADREKVLNFYRNISAHHPMITDDGAFRFVSKVDNDSPLEVYSEIVRHDDRRSYEAFRVHRPIRQFAAAE
ncbi:hypothetical protein [Sinorhizobium meliloti]|uniref:hypothetical protein n=1 Tax=Rhizobium meliloti TaxID=382 RepID=UPI0001E4EB36|nr:hypothetical protein [Sinorhizobium meliloti]AEG09297.1 hypothetical protein SinmeB_5041 [Sinorhizobium meliloti BL225C]MDE4548781.1 hypothetical protein [Sinorhizobium meliloti]MDE4570579.1 hypothetical protein [Sinorhizobium meliloti]SDZ03102.1 hypothetical protein SAMN04244576_04690 [Sinorhizobium meliloti]